MFKIIAALIITLFSTGALATVYHVYLPSECKELIGSDISFHEDISKKELI